MPTARKSIANSGICARKDPQNSNIATNPTCPIQLGTIAMTSLCRSYLNASLPYRHHLASGGINVQFDRTCDNSPKEVARDVRAKSKPFPREEWRG